MQVRIAVASVLRNVVVVAHGAAVLRLDIKTKFMNQREKKADSFCCVVLAAIISRVYFALRNLIESAQTPLFGRFGLVVKCQT